ncbi:NUDIX hydrolase domain-like protein [Nitzschia inconspicua]|uniref:NUDIX hydrolase domain-like protein n=1 Tax=Nitzschia inconspicua TaxID=303405 RepID=A0A9K3KZM2_9STRA|nr:NUDIX hydrolase domain-like protein [Nitzschia inconspicua]
MTTTRLLLLASIASIADSVAAFGLLGPTTDAKVAVSSLSRKNFLQYAGAAAMGGLLFPEISQADVNVGGKIRFGDESIMSPKEHGTSSKPVQPDLMYGVSNKLADKICNYNRHFAEMGGYFQSTPFEEQVLQAKTPITFYDSVTGKPLFVAPINRSPEEFLQESKIHGWPSFRDDEVVWDNVRVLKNSGETVSVDGTHLGHNLPDRKVEATLSVAFRATMLSGSFKLRASVQTQSQMRFYLAAENTETSSESTGNTGDRYPRAAVSTAVRCHVNDSSGSEPCYLLIKRGNPPNAGKWSFPGGKLEWGESTIVGAQRELTEETSFHGQDSLEWHPEPYATADSIIAAADNHETSFHFLIAIAFAQLQADALPIVKSKDDAKEAKWWPLSEIQVMTNEMTTPGLVQRVERAEFLYRNSALL